VLGRVIETRFASVQELVRVRLGTDGSPAEGLILRSALEDFAQPSRPFGPPNRSCSGRTGAGGVAAVRRGGGGDTRIFSTRRPGRERGALPGHLRSCVFRDPRLDDDGRIVEANPAALSVTGFARKQLLGRRLSDLFPDQPGGPAEAHGIARLRRADGALRSLDLTSHRGIAPGRHLIFV
jgi:hypothetical protein